MRCWKSHSGMMLATLGLVLFVVSGCHQTSTHSTCLLNADKQESRGALLATRYPDLEALKRVIDIEYVTGEGNAAAEGVMLRQCANQTAVESELSKGVTEDELRAARDGDISDRLDLVFESPYTIWHKDDLYRIYLLSRRRPDLYDAGDPAFFDLALACFERIPEEHLASIPPADTTEKGYINTFNHVTAQAFMTSLFSEEVADHVADLHERHNMPALITGTFTEDELSNPKNNAIDNYVDMINNEWGQELGKRLKEEFDITDNTKWSPDLLANYLNELQQFYRWSLDIDMKPFLPQDEIVIRFSRKLNLVLGEVSDSDVLD